MGGKMSSLVYGAVNAQRESSPARKSKAEKPPGLGSYVDVLTALVPAEVLAINALLLSLFVKSSTGENGDVITKITDPSAAKLMFWLSILGCIAFYFIGDRAKNQTLTVDTGLLSNWNWLRALIPALAYVGWTMLQKSTPFDAVAPDMSEGSRVIVAVFLAAILAGVAKRLSDEADKKDPGAV
jgi:hypothetical protein